MCVCRASCILAIVFLRFRQMQGNGPIHGVEGDYADEFEESCSGRREGLKYLHHS